MSDLAAALSAAEEQIRAKDRQLVLMTETIADQARALRVRTVAEDDARNPTIAELWTLYMAVWAREGWAGSVRGLMKAPLAHFGARRVSEVTRAAWTYYRDEVRAKQKTIFGTPPAAHTQNLELARFKALLNWAVDEGLIAANPLTRVRKIRAKRRRQTEPTEQDLAALIADATPLERAYVLLGWDCGMRMTEIRTVTWRQIDFAKCRVQIYWTVSKNHHAREVVMRQATVEAIQALPRTPGTDAVFANPKTKRPWSKTAMWLRLRTLIDRAGLVADPADGNVHFHDGRHHWMSKILRKGVRLPVAQKLSGHLSLAAAQVYIHVNDDDLEDARLLLDADRMGPHQAPPPTETTEKIAIREKGA